MSCEDCEAGDTRGYAEACLYDMPACLFSVIRSMCEPIGLSEHELSPMTPINHASLCCSLVLSAQSLNNNATYHRLMAQLIAYERQCITRITKLLSLSYMAMHNLS